MTRFSVTRFPLRRCITVVDDRALWGYSLVDVERFLPEEHSTRRSDFARDRARLFHSSALRRLAAKTQVLSPTAGVDFARNRLTHSLEVAQIGRELATSLDLDPDVVDTACLAHDIGHPPFGHNGERALNAWAHDIGGFEGNAQTFRLLTRLEPKVFGDGERPYGLNLTRASLDASCKYPWPNTRSVTDPSGRAKFGFYADDEAAFTWMRHGAPEGVRCIEAEVMDLSDDIAYSVHDFEDAVFSGYIDIAALGSRADHDDLVDSMHSWVGGEIQHDELVAAFDRLDSLDVWVHSWDGSRRDQARLKNLTSQLIGRFAAAATAATREAYAHPDLARFGGHVVVPREQQAEIAVLKGIVAAFVMSRNARQPIYAQQREVLLLLADGLLERGPDRLDTGFAEDWRAADTDGARRRVIVDQVANLTDQSALAWFERLC
ncbi:deoxyguanosinetriphosphate triphosphohydrolase [Rathayibacter toxicus]|nr:deoxyguanosinetriphosphate triphosphohydrolase [Rathayibacter toxicus]QWL28310.1 deoxyguanosinetriphosphate triphosphohydrolase [Rathayibacter toxicus]QWL32500.1 deoxyguanosinetriphosphate triphosphohydrolase [Rathayibacter toxicus]QWL34594.1 deoxyguanosinetriphosphate triphosphohydrolase [Rathayibacter toxicus]QWL36726.1 deoxyguanosinetriphosphate triphosphohydrolase [Rathayibacter toxicus]